MGEVKEEKKQRKYKLDDQGYILNKHWWVVHPDCQLIRKNRFRHNKDKSIKILEPGLRFLWPMFHAGRQINIVDKNDCFHDIKGQTRDDFEVKVDIDIVTRVDDSRKIVLAASNPTEILTSVLESILRRFIKGKTYDELKEIKFDINDPTNSWIKAELDDFKNIYGLEIKQILLKKVILPPELQDDYQKSIIQKKENERRVAEAEGKLRVAKINVKTVQLERKNDNEMTAKLARKLTDAGFSAEQAAQIINVIKISESGATTIFNIGGSPESSTAAMTSTLLEENSRNRRSRRGRS